MNPTFDAPLVLLMQNFFTIAFFVFITICIFLYQSKSKYLIAFLPLLALSSHQFEEYVLSPLLLGDFYHFLNLFGKFFMQAFWWHHFSRKGIITRARLVAPF